MRSHSARSTSAAWLRAIVGGTAIAVVWLVILPATGSHPGLSRQIRKLDARGIDPSALFYTELDMLRPEIVGDPKVR